MRWLVRNLLFHRFHALGLIFGVALTCTVLIGALGVGDSVRSSLERRVKTRMGNLGHAVVAGEGFFRADLATGLDTALSVEAVPIIRVPGTVATPQGNGQIPAAWVMGVPAEFWQQNQVSVPAGLEPINDAQQGAAVNRVVADRLGLSLGDRLIVRVEAPSALPRDAVVAAVSQTRITISLPVTAILEEADFGAFNLEAHQLSPANVFLPLNLLQQRIERPASANYILIAGKVEEPAIQTALRRHWRLEDAGIELVAHQDEGFLEVRSPRVFLQPALTDALKKLTPEATPVLTYLVNDMRLGTKLIPYSMVTAIGTPNWLGRYESALDLDGLGDNGIVLNRWAADDFRANLEDPITLNYYVVDQANRLEQRSASFVVRAVLEMDDPLLQPHLMPAFPGLQDADNCREWDTGIPLEMDRIRDKDETYWDDFAGTPKAIISYRSGSEIWGNRFGNVTAIRLPLERDTETRLRTRLQEIIDPAKLGIAVLPLGAQAQRAVDGAMGFGGLFIGFSLFIILAALLLNGLLFSFQIEARREEIGLLGALGFSDRQIRRRFLIEAVALCLPGALLAWLLASLYGQGLVVGLRTIWSGAVGQWPISYALQPTSLAVGLAIGIGMSLATVWWTLRRLRHMAAIALLTKQEITQGSDLKKRRLSHPVLWGCVWLAAALALGFKVPVQQEQAAGQFFGVGALALLAGLAFFAVVLRGWRGQPSWGFAGRLGLALANLARRPRRSLAVVAMLASGAFLVVALESQRRDPMSEALSQAGGSGGFDLYAESTQPIHRDLADPRAIDYYSLDADAFTGAHIVPMRQVAGDDASCLNLNRAQQPHLFGVLPDRLTARFSFKQTGDSSGDPWQLLVPNPREPWVPAICDFNTLTYSLGKKVGDTLEMVSEQGERYQIKIVAALDVSIFQDGLLLAESVLAEKYPSKAGYRRFLVDTTDDRVEAIQTELTDVFADDGMWVRPAAARLKDFLDVQNTYLSMFQMLGFLGLLLGSLGMGLIVGRHLLERRSELAVQRAIGFPKHFLARLLLLEHALLLAVGLIGGTLAALVAVWPRIAQTPAAMPWLSVGTLLAVLMISGLLWIALAICLTMRGDLMAALRKE